MKTAADGGLHPRFMPGVKCNEMKTHHIVFALFLLLSSNADASWTDYPEPISSISNVVSLAYDRLFDTKVVDPQEYFLQSVQYTSGHLGTNLQEWSWIVIVMSKTNAHDTAAFGITTNGTAVPTTAIFSGLPYAPSSSSVPTQDVMAIVSGATGHFGREYPKEKDKVLVCGIAYLNKKNRKTVNWRWVVTFTDKTNASRNWSFARNKDGTFELVSTTT